MTVENTGLALAKDSLETNLYNLGFEFDNLTTDNVEMMAQIEEQKLKIEEFKAELVAAGDDEARLRRAIGRLKKETPVEQNVTLNIDLPSNVELDTFKCESCGGVLSPENVEMVAGAPVVSCPYCGTTYQLKEDPKW